MVLNTVEAPYIIADVAFQGPGSGITGFAPGLTTGDTTAVLADLASTASGQGAALVGYQSSLTGAGPQTVQSWQQRTVLVTDFYANGVSGALVDPTGVIDSTLGIQAAVNTGLPVVFPNAGTFKISSPITYTGKVIIFGNGSTILGDGQSFAFTTASGSRVRDLNFQPITIPFTIKRDVTVWTATGAQVVQSLQGYIPTSQDTDIWGCAVGLGDGVTGFTATITGTAPTQTMVVTGLTTGQPNQWLAAGMPVYYPPVNIPGNIIGTITAAPAGNANGTYTITTASTQSQAGVKMSAGLSSTIMNQIFVRPYQRPGIWFKTTSATPNTNVEVSGITGFGSSIVLEGYQDSTVRDCNLGGNTGEATIYFYNGLTYDVTGTLIIGYTQARGLHNKVINNRLTYGSYCGVALAGNDYFTVIGNSSQYNGESAIKTMSHDTSAVFTTATVCSNGSIIGNNAFGNFYDGIDGSAIYGAATPAYIVGYNVISGNTCAFNRATGISTGGSSNGSVVGNTCSNNGTSGISAIANYSTVSGNTCSGNCAFSLTGVNNQWGSAQCYDIFIAGDGVVSVGNAVNCSYMPQAYAYLHEGPSTNSFVPSPGHEGIDVGNSVQGISTSKFVWTGIPGDLNEYRAASTACTGALTVSVSWKLSRLGDIVTLQLPATMGTGVAASGIVYGVQIPASFRPTETMDWYVAEVKNNGAFLTTPGLVQVDTSGTISVFQNSGGANFTAGQPAGLLATSVSWMI